MYYVIVCLTRLDSRWSTATNSVRVPRAFASKIRIVHGTSTHSNACIVSIGRAAPTYRISPKASLSSAQSDTPPYTSWMRRAPPMPLARKPMGRRRRYTAAAAAPAPRTSLILRIRRRAPAAAALLVRVRNNHSNTMTPTPPTTRWALWRWLRSRSFSPYWADLWWA